MKSESRLPRKLAVILHADVAGYSRLAGLDEDATHRRLKDSLNQIFNLVPAYHGRVVSTAGDAVLAMFEAAVDALSCAAAVQQNLAAYNQNIPDEQKVQFRIGINLGDVIEDDGDIFGDGVNVAARLEGLAEPGGICIAESVYTSVGSKLPLEYSDMGPQTLKNIAEPIRAYQVNLKSGAVLPGPRENSNPVVQSGKRQLPLVNYVLIFALLAAVAVILSFKPWETREEPASMERMALPLPDKPSIAVLPLDNMSDDLSQNYFADGMTEDLITDLSKIPGLFVIARNSSFAYKGQNKKISQVAEELGVRYVLEGSVRRAGDQIRINAQLIDATTGGHVWAERYDGLHKDIFALQDQVTRQIVAALKVNLTDEDEVPQVSKATDNVEAHDAFLRGWAHYKLGTPEDLALAIPFFDKAVSLDNNYSLAHASLASLFWQVKTNDWAFNLGMISFEVEDRIDEHLQRALKSPTPLAHDLQSRIYLSQSLFDKAVLEAEKAVALDNNDATAHASLANALIRSQRPEQGLASIQNAMRLDPYYSPGYLTILGAAQFGLKQYDRAVDTLKRAIKRNPNHDLPHLYLAISYSNLGRIDDAETVIEDANYIHFTRAQNELGIMESASNDGYFPGIDTINFQTFGNKEIQNQVRTSLKQIPALNWHYLITVHPSQEVGDTWVEVEGATRIGADQAKMLFDKGVTFIETGIEKILKRVRIPNSHYLPSAWSVVENWDGSIPKLNQTTLNTVVSKNQEVVFSYWCHENPIPCTGSWEAARAVSWGYEKVYFIGTRGLSDWIDAGYPLEYSQEQ